MATIVAVMPLLAIRLDGLTETVMVIGVPGVKVTTVAFEAAPLVAVMCATLARVIVT